MKSSPILALCFLGVLVGSAHGQPCIHPLQVDTSIAMPADPGASVSFSSQIGGGEATVSGMATNQLNRQTVQLDLLFDYTTPSQIIFDELIECIEGAIEDNAPALINANLINLNPNRVSLAYRVTLYRPPDASYQLRLRVWGNYE